LIYGLFNDTFNSSDCIASNVKIFGELGRSVKKQLWLKLKYYRGTCLGGTEENQDNLIHCSRSPGYDYDPRPSVCDKKVPSN